MANKKTDEYYYKSKYNHRGEKHTLVGGSGIGKVSAVNYCGKSKSASLVVLGNHGIVLLIKVWKVSNSFDFKMLLDSIKSDLNKFGNPFCLAKNFTSLRGYCGSCVEEDLSNIDTKGFDLNNVIIPNIIGLGGDISTGNIDKRGHFWTKKVKARNRINPVSNSKRELILNPLMNAYVFLKTQMNG